MLNFNFLNYFVLTPFIVFIFFIWFFFVKNNFYYVRVSPGHNDVLKNSNFLKKLNHVFFNNFFYFIFVFYFFFIFFLKIDFLNSWFNHIKINNFLLNLVFLLLILNFILIKIIKMYNNKNINFNIDYFFALFNLFIFIPSIFICNTMYTFIFLLEINSILILYKFSVSKYFFNQSLNNKNVFIKNTPKYYINMLFFQYWINFFSSVILFFSIFNILFFLGSSEWFVINVLIKFNLSINNNIFYFLIYFIFIVGMFVKIGFTPSHLFKIEIYKGLPLISILFYTVFYFISFFLYFMIILFYYLNNIKIYTWFFLFIFILIGLIYIISLLFDVNLLKTFFAYSTIINSLTFTIIVFVSLN